VNRFWERVMLALVVCVPVPALALSGLNVPLPSVVERVAAALVPFASAATLDDGTTLAAGTIVRTQRSDAGRPTPARGTRTQVAVVRVRRSASKPRPATRVRAAQPKARVAVSTLAPATTHGEDTANVTETPVSTPVADTPASTERPNETKPKERANPTAADVDVKPDPKLDVDVVPEPEVEPPLEPALDVVPPPVDLPGSETGDAHVDESARETAERHLGT
jgi:hypothetical protein